MTPYDRLTMAIARLETHGWIQGDFNTAAGDCFVGALFTEEERAYRRNAARRLFVAMTPQAFAAARQAEEEIFAACLACGFGDPADCLVWNFMRDRRPTAHAIQWNDEKGRTKQEVIARMEQGRDRLLHQEADRAMADTAEPIVPTPTPRASFWRGTVRTSAGALTPEIFASALYHFDAVPFHSLTWNEEAALVTTT